MIETEFIVTRSGLECHFSVLGVWKTQLPSEHGFDGGIC